MLGKSLVSCIFLLVLLNKPAADRRLIFSICTRVPSIVSIFKLSQDQLTQVLHIDVTSLSSNVTNNNFQLEGKVK